MLADETSDQMDDTQEAMNSWDVKVPPSQVSVSQKEEQMQQVRESIKNIKTYHNQKEWFSSRRKERNSIFLETRRTDESVDATTSIALLRTTNLRSSAMTETFVTATDVGTEAMETMDTLQPIVRKALEWTKRY